MNDDLVRADPRLRRNTLIALGLAAALAVGAILFFQQWLNTVGANSGTDILILRLRRMIGIGMTGSALCLALLAWYAAHQSSRTKLAGQWPVPGTRVIRDTAIRRGPAASHIARLLQMTALVLLVLAFSTGYFSLRMLASA